MNRLRFQIEAVSTESGRRGRRIVFARKVDPGDFRQGPELRLDGCRVHAFGMPRAIAPDGTPRLDLFFFTLTREPPFPALQVGAFVDLTWPA